MWAQHLAQGGGVVELVLVMKTQLQIPDAVILHEALGLEISGGRHHRREHALVPWLDQ